jgi:hypothetical protein
MNAVVYTEFRKLGEEYLDSTTREDIQMGYMGNMWSARIWVTRLIQGQEIKIYGGNELISEFPLINQNRNLIINRQNNLSDNLPSAEVEEHQNTCEKVEDIKTNKRNNVQEKAKFEFLVD